MMSSRIKKAMIALNDTISMEVSGGYTVIVIPHQDGEVVISIDGKPVPSHRADGGIPPEEALSLAMGERELTQAEIAMRQIKKTLDEI